MQLTHSAHRDGNIATPVLLAQRQCGAYDAKFNYSY